MIVVPNLEMYLQLIEPEMQLEKQKNEMKRHEAWRVYGALLVSFFMNWYETSFSFVEVPQRWYPCLVPSNLICAWYSYFLTKYH